MENLKIRIARRLASLAKRAHQKLTRYIDHASGIPGAEQRLTIGRAYEKGWEDCPCVFVLSTGRTGTQTLATLLGLSSDVAAEHEAFPRLVKASFDAFMDTDETQWLGQWVPVVLAARDEFVLRASARKKVYVETNYRLTYLARALRDAFPASRFIHLHRDPYAVIRSGMRRGAYMPGKEWYVGRIRPHPDDPVAAQWDGLSTLEKEAWRWARINAEAMAFLAELPAARKLELPSAKLFSGAEDVCEEVFSFAGAKRPAMKKIGQVLGMRKNAQDHYQDTKMFNWGKERREVVQPFIEEIAHKLGYEV